MSLIVKKIKSYIFKAHFFGDNLFNRWDIITHFTWLLNSTGLVKIKELVSLNSGVKLEIWINHETNLKKLWDNLRKIIRTSFYEEQDYTEIKEAAGNMDQWIEAYIERFGMQDSLNDAWIMNKLIKYSDLNFSRVISIAEAAPPKTGFNIFKALVQKDQKPAFNKAAEFAEKLVMSLDYEVQIFGIDLLKALLKKQYQPAFEKAAATAEKSVNSSDINEIRLGIRLLSLLVENKYQPAFEKAAKAAAAAISDVQSSSYVRKLGVSIFKDLVKQKYKSGFSEATKAAVKAINDKDFLVSTFGIDLFILLLDKNREPTKLVIEGLLVNPDIREDIKKHLGDLLKPVEED